MKRFMIIIMVCAGFSQPDSTVKIFSTDLMRTNILTGKPKESVKKNEAHFRAVYYPSGELKSVEFFPANWDKGRRKKVKSPNKLRLYYQKWNPKKTGTFRRNYQKKRKGGIPLSCDFRWKRLGTGCGLL